jgi:hypothetical protein
MPINTRHPVTRQAAIETGATYYLTGQPCPKGHIAVRYTSNGACSYCLGVVVDISQQEIELSLAESKSGRAIAKRRAFLERQVRTVEKQRSNRIRNRAYIRTYKASNPCADCGANHPWYIMEFDHLESRARTGKKTIAQLMPGATLERIQCEISQCDLVCANCHKIRTHQRAVAACQRIP